SGPGDLAPQFGAIAYAVGEPARELLHLSDRVGPARIAQMLEISRKQNVAIAVRGLFIPSRSHKLFILSEDPRIRAGSAPDHHSITVGLANHSQGVFGRVDIAIPDDGNSHSLLYCANQVPIRRSGISLLPRSGMHCDGFHAHAFRNAGNLAGDNALLVPARARLDRQGNAHSVANRA